MTIADSDEQVRPPAPSVFLSYARPDRKRALQVISALEAAGIKVWWDGLLEGGDTFLPTTEAALESADAVVVLWSRTSIDSHWVRDEATSGRDRRALVPLSLDGSMPPLGFRQFQVIDLSGWRGKADSPEVLAVVRAVQALAGQEGRPLPRPALTATAPSRRGLLIGGGVAAVAMLGGAGLWWSGVLGGARRADNSIAVIPFGNLGGDPAQAYFSDGLSEELRSTLARNSMLRIAAPTSSAEFRDAVADALAIARKLGVAFVLRGSVRQGQDMIRVAAELVSGTDASLIWTQTLDRKLSDALSLQSEIAATVAKALSAEINAQAIAAGHSGDWLVLGGTKNAKAFDAYLRGKALMEASVDEASDRAALARFEQAVALDPAYASALSAQSKALTAIANEIGDLNEIRKLYDRAILSGQAAIKAAPALAEAHSALGYALYNGRLDPKAAREPYEHSRELGAGDANVMRNFALYCAYTGRPGDAADAMATTLVLDPLNPAAFRAAGYVAYAQRDYAKTIAMMRRALAISPKYSSANFAIGSALYLTGQYAEAKAAFAAEPLASPRLQGQAVVEHKAGNLPVAQRALQELVSGFGDGASYQQAVVLAQWGDREGALRQLDRAASVRDSGLLLAKTDPMLDPLRADPRFDQLLSRIGLS